MPTTLLKLPLLQPPLLAALESIGCYLQLLQQHCPLSSLAAEGLNLHSVLPTLLLPLLLEPLPLLAHRLQLLRMLLQPLPARLGPSMGTALETSFMAGYWHAQASRRMTL